MLFARWEHRDRASIQLRTSSAVLLSKLCHQESRRVSRASRWSLAQHANHGRATGTQAFGHDLVAQMESRSSFQQGPKPVTSCASADRAGTPVSFSLTHKAIDWSTEHTGLDEPCIPRPSTPGMEPLTRMTTNRRAPTIRGKAVSRVLSGAAFDRQSLFREPSASLSKSRNSNESNSGSQTAAARQVLRHGSTTRSETR